MTIKSNLSQTPEQAYFRIKEVGETIARNDPTRPEYHFHAPGQWMDDPNGSIYHNGYYHIMYGTNPDSDKNRGGMPYKTSSNKWSPNEPDWMEGLDIWGHARSRDMVHWEHMPISLFPNPEKDEYFIWWGCTRINGEGVPTIIYTSIGYQKNPTDSAEQFIAYGDEELIHWKQADDLNPILTDAIHKGTKYYEWRDPYLFSHAGRTFMILGGTTSTEEKDRNAVVLLYEALDTSYSQWEFRGELFRYPDSSLRSIECPNVVQLGDKWVLFISPHGPVEYYVGDIDFTTYKFTYEYKGILNPSINFYATNLVFDDDGRCILWGAIEGFQNTKGWNGAAALPRIVSMKENGVLRQVVAPEIQKLRGERKTAQPGEAIGMRLGTFESLIQVDPDDHGKVLLSYGQETIEIRFSGEGVSVGNLTLTYAGETPKAQIDLFVDKSILEVFVDDEHTLSLVVPTCTGNAILKLESERGTARMTAWEYETDGLFCYYL